MWGEGDLDLVAALLVHIVLVDELHRLADLCSTASKGICRWTNGSYSCTAQGKTSVSRNSPMSFGLAFGLVLDLTTFGA